MGMILPDDSPAVETNININIVGSQDREGDLFHP